MADDGHENGTSNGNVPEIELIIKVRPNTCLMMRHHHHRRLAESGI